MMTTQEMVEKINQWLRYHSGWNVKIELLDLYGCISVNVYHRKERIYYNFGANLDKRLHEALSFLASQEE